MWCLKCDKQPAEIGEKLCTGCNKKLKSYQDRDKFFKNLKKSRELKKISKTEKYE